MGTGKIAPVPIIRFLTDEYGGELQVMAEPREEEGEPLPLVAPCRRLAPGEPLRWLKEGWADLRRAPLVSMSLGVLVMLGSWLVSLIAWRIGSFVLLAAMLSAFVLVGPLLAMGFYSVSARLERGETPTFARVWRNAKASAPNVAVFALILMVIGLVWARAASMVHIFFPVEGGAGWTALATFLLVGSAVGSIFCALVFTAAAFSLPMIKDREVDMVTAVLSSANAVLRNKATMFVWALIIIAGVAVGFVTALFGLAVIVPWLGHATWHAYRAAVDASAWEPRRVP